MQAAPFFPLDQPLTTRRLNMRYLAIIFILAAALITESYLLARAQWNTISFGYNHAVQFVDPDGHNQVYLSTSSTTGTIDFTLYSVTEAQFSGAYATLHNSALPNTAGLTSVNSWQVSYTGEGGYYGTPVKATLPSVPSGLYLLTAKDQNGDLAATLVVLSRQALVVKTEPSGQVAIWASQLQSGAPVASMNITLHNAAGVPVGQGVTNGDGVARFTLNSADLASLQNGLVVGKAGAEVTAAGFGWEWSSYIYYGYFGAPNRIHTVYLHTDRPIYRPGHTVNYAAILRRNDGSQYLPVDASTPVEATLRDSRYNVVTTQTLTPDQFGLVHGDFILGDEPPLGAYTLELAVGSGNSAETFTQSFKVEEYRKPEYQVKVSATEPHVIAGDETTVTVQADYFFGQPVANADVTLKVYRNTYRDNYYWWEWGYYDYYPPTYQEPIDELTGKTDANGQFSTPYKPDSEPEYTTTYTFVATVTDALEQPIESSLSLPVYWNSSRLEMQTDKYGYRSTDSIVVNLAARGHDDAPVANQQITVKVEQDYYNQDNQTIAQQRATTDASGNAQVTLTNIPQGWYRLVASATDDRGRTVTTYRYLWIYDPADGSWWYYSNDELSISVDKASYAPGDTAQLLIQSRITNTVALVTLERDSVLQEIAVPINGPVTTVDVAVTADFAPNVFATVHLFKKMQQDENNPYWGRYGEAELIAARTELIVPATNQRLNVSITANAAQYGAGDSAALTLQVTDSAGNPVVANVTLALVDEAIFALAADNSGDIFQTFHGRRGNRVSTFESPTQVEIYGPAPVDADPGGAPSPTGTPAPTQDPSGELRGDGVNARRVFLDTAYWNPTIVTDATGQAVVTVPLPDNLTTWRVIARAVTVETKVGEAISSILVTQDIIAQPNLPRFGVLGDRFGVGLVGQNFSGAAVSGQAELTADNLLLLDAGARTLSLPNGGSQAANWTAVASHIGVGQVTAALNTAAGGDLVELPLEIKPFAAPERLAAAGQANPAASETFDMPFNAIHDASQLTIRLAPSVALGLLDDLDSLIDYPYGCVEQTMSRLLPSVVAAQAYDQLAIPNPKAEQVPEIVAQGLQKLYGFQLPEGGWGWFADDEAGASISTYVLLGLVMVEKAGYAVEAQVLDNGFTYLDGALPGVTSGNTKAYALYVKALAGRGNLNEARALAAQQDQLDSFGLAMLALALHLNGDDAAAQKVVDRLLAQAADTGMLVYWPTDGARDWYHWQSMSSAEKNTAAAIRALSTLRPNAAQLPKAVRWLMQQRNGSYYLPAGWRDTQATAFAVLGLTDYILVSGELNASYDYTVRLNDAEIAQGQVTPATARQPIAPIVLTGDALRLGLNELVIERTGGADQPPLYYAMLLRQELFYEGFAALTSVDQGLSIERSYKLVEGQPRGDDAFNKGDLIEVKLTVKAQTDMAYVHITSPNPAGFEPLTDQMNGISYGGDWWWPRWFEWGYNRKDVRDDSVDFFVTHLYAGEHEYTYRMRAARAGDFSALPAQAYPMYEEAIWGRSSSALLSIAPETLVQRPTLAGDVDHNCFITEFDLRQAAAAWGGSSATSDVVADGVVDLRDLASIAARRGATCTADRSGPGNAGGQANFELKLVSLPTQAGDMFQMEIRLAAGAAPNGFGLRLTYAPATVRTARVNLSPALLDGLPMQTHVDNAQGQVWIGAMHVPTALVVGELLATVDFVAAGSGQVQVNADQVQALDASGRMLNGAAQSDQSEIVVAPQTIRLPIVKR
ncbi:MAG: MG2 domain-containing protein [Caldilineaceae bacterium]